MVDEESSSKLKPLKPDLYAAALPCSVSAFGVASDDSPLAPVAAPPFTPKDDPLGCKAAAQNWRGSSDLSPAGKRPHPWLSPAPSLADPGPAEWVSRPALGPMASRVVVLDRGDCMFEQKARAAEAQGAAAVVIVNSEYHQRFIMAGMTKPKGPSMPGKATPEAQPSSSELPPMRVPVVMVSREHGELIRSVASRLTGGQEVLRGSNGASVSAHPSRGGFAVEVNVEKKPRGSGPSAGEPWPVVRVAQNSIQVLGMGDWGAFLSSPSGTEWQLFVIKKGTEEEQQPAKVPVE